MSKVIVSVAAYRDLCRLEGWLDERDPNAAERLGPLLLDAIMSLSDMAARGRRTADSRIREIVVRFGSAAHLVQYRIDPDAVIVVRVRHSREGR